LDVKENTVWRWENGKSSPSAPIIVRLASALNTTVAYLSGETDNPARSAPAEQPLPESNVRPIPGPYVMVPVLGPESALCCGPGSEISDISEVEDEVQYYEPVQKSWLTGTKGKKPYYITHVDGDSMEPLIQDGERVLVNPNEEVKHGDVAVVVWNGRVIIRGVKFERNGNVRLVPSNKDYQEDVVLAEDAPYTLYFKGVVIRYLGFDRPSRGIL
jgi:SOS-response transcriptional repressor LexA